MWVGKLAPPQMQIDVVTREALLARLQSQRQISLALIISPPGFGKTILLSQWRLALQQQLVPTPVAWLSLDEADSDVNRFLAYILLALEGAGIELAGLALHAHEQVLDANPERTLAELLRALDKCGKRVTLMLDDYHRAASPAVDEVFLTLLERGSAWLQFVVASRTRPRWSLASLKARGLLHQVDASDLVLSLSEASQILGASMDRSALTIVHSRTEGWAVAVQLARLWFLRGKGSSNDLQAFSGRVADVAEYLAEQILENMPQECREFLIETSLLERFNAELADAVRGRNDSGELLERLSHFDALLVPLDAGRTWFRYHLMLSEFLSPRLDRRRAGEIHRAAAAWLGRETDWVSAVAHALSAQDTDLAVQLVHQAGGWELVLTKGIQYTKSLLQQFDEVTKRTEPELLLMQAYLHAKLGNEALAVELFRLAEVAVKGVPRLLRDLKIIDALVHVYFDHFEDFDKWPKTGAAANDSMPDDPLGQATLLCAGAITSLAWGRIGDAGQAAQDALVRFRLSGNTLGENYGLMHLSQALSISGHIAAGRQSVDEGIALAEKNFGTDSSLKALVGCFKAQHLYWQGQWLEAVPWLKNGKETLERVDGWFELFAATAEVSWRIALRQEGLSSALAILEDAAELARRRNLQRLSNLVLAWRVDLLAQCGLLSEAQQEADAASLEAKMQSHPGGLGGIGLNWRFLDAGSLALARMQMAAGTPQAAQARLEQTSRSFRAAGLLLPAWRIELFAMLAKHRARDGNIPMQETHDALAPIFQHGLTGLLLEVGPPMLRVLQQLEGTLPPQAAAVMTQLRGWRTHPPRQRTLFSAKESEVLNLLMAGQQSKAIARALGISENTVKFHLKNIFQKLGVDNRAAAIGAALRQGFSGQAEEAG